MNEITDINLSSEKFREQKDKKNNSALSLFNFCVNVHYFQIF
jgi:hypothetical protein